MASKNYETGNLGEKLTLDYYLQNGYILVVKNFNYYRKQLRGRQGEIDLIFEKSGKLYLVEVKARSNTKYGLPSEQITKSKLQHLYKTYQYFLTASP